jgi:hypothetical protein
MSIASLPMYDLPALRQATDDWWSGLARALTAAGLEGVPKRLTREANSEELWCRPDLLISQTCGYPLTHALAGQVRLVATPAYHVEGCDGALYRSVFLVTIRPRRWQIFAAAGLPSIRGPPSLATTACDMPWRCSPNAGPCSRRWW